MHHKRQRSPAAIIFGLLVILAIGGGAFLMTRDIPAPMHPIEKPLDAQTFTGGTQQ